MNAKLQIPYRSVSPIYRDDRWWREPYTLCVRGHATLEFFRFRTLPEAEKARGQWKDLGYELLKETA